jgi:hypothetical protein
MSFKSKLRYLYRWDLIPNRLQDRYLRYTRALPDRNYWRGLKDKYKGQAGFVIGNGPSLKIEDLTEIKKHGFVSIASNKIYLAFDQTEWRPNFFTMADTLLWSKIKSTIHNDIKIVHIPSYLDFQSCNREIKYFRGLLNSYNGKTSNFSGNLVKGAFDGSSVTYENLQIAVHIGLNPIYLIGCDHHYPNEKNITPGKPIAQMEDNSHFIKGYRKKGELVLPAPIKKMNVAYATSKNYSDKFGIKIYNATRGGHLEVFERINLDDIFCNSEKHLHSSKT